MRVLFFLGFAALLAALASACTTVPTPQTLCAPGENIFCRCRGGDAGTKQCKGDGMSFEECVSDDGRCDEASGEPLGGDSTGKLLFEPCEDDAECSTGLCAMGFCTRDCATYTECSDPAAEVYGDCVALLQLCVPYCETQTDCGLYGEPSGCGYTVATDAYAVVVCADWLDGPPLPLDGFLCATDDECHLGVEGAERVCQFDQCMTGCHAPADCSAGGSCLTSTQPGTCG